MLGIIYEPSLNYLHLKIFTNLIDCHKVRQIIEAFGRAYENDQ